MFFWTISDFWNYKITRPGPGCFTRRDFWPSSGQNGPKKLCRPNFARRIRIWREIEAISFLKKKKGFWHPKIFRNFEKSVIRHFYDFFSLFYRFFGEFSMSHNFFPEYMPFWILDSRACRVQPVCVFSGQSGDTNFSAILMKHPTRDSMKLHNL